MDSKQGDIRASSRNRSALENYTDEHGILMMYANRPITQHHHDGLSRTQLFGTPERTDRRADASGVTRDCERPTGVYDSLSSMPSRRRGRTRSRPQ